MTHLWVQFPTRHKIYIASIISFLMLILLVPTEKATASRQNETVPERLQPGVRYDLSLQPVVPIENKKTSEQRFTQPEVVANESALNDELSSTEKKVGESLLEASAPSLPKIDWRDEKIRRNDSLAKIFERNSIPAKTLIEVSRSGKAVDTLVRKLIPGQVIQLGFVEDELNQIVYPLSQLEFIEIHKTETGYSAQQLKKQTESEVLYAGAEIHSSFWNAGLQAGLTDNQIMNLANIFGWDIDFALDIRKGDSFSVVYEELLVDGEPAGFGNILAAEFTSQNQTFRAIRHQDGEYYTPQGNSMRKAFLRAPVNFKYISSNFNPRRLHPVTGRVAPHRGIDYAARTGTPVVSAGDGKVIKSGYSSLNGNYVFIQHGKEYVTKYLHLHKRYVKTGQRVKQNQKIGTVGATGRVTGPHLHYEFLVNGVHRNPKTVKLPKALPLPAAELKTFKQTANSMVALLERNKNTLLAKTSQD
ncbi:peptidoglycan DD-metalloendopeptidase family protein [Gayadomonas joobiniege]|uniref:peptidoglycan DD-metalloendopeptidase family protein n=1 Tax=Gayadomonas joobiniege TaxID=1234606 RepID=UPI000475090F